MITNKIITYYHKTLDKDKLPVWNRYIFNKVWIFGGKGSSLNKGYENANNVNVRIPIEYIKSKDIFAIGDIIAIGKRADISKQSDLEGTEFYNVTSINVNDFGYNQHIHLGGS